MRKEIINIEAKVDDAVKSVDKLNDSVEDLGKSIKDNNEEVKDSAKGIEKASKSSAKGVKGLARGFKGVGVAIKAAGIGLVIAALGTLKEVFTSNQKVADAFSVAFETISLVFNELVTAVVNVYESVSKSSEKFDALGKVIKGLLTIAITPLKLAFYEIKFAIQGAQLIWEKSFLGGQDPKKIKELSEALQETKNDIKEVAIEAVNAGKDVATNFGEAVTEFGGIVTEVIDETSKISVKGAYDSAKANVQLKNTAALAAAQQGLLVEKYDILAEKQRQIRDEERNSIEDRKKANDELNIILDQQEEAMLKQANAQVAAAQAEVDKNASIENQVALTEALANKQGVLAQVEGFRSEQKMNDLALDREAKELTNAKLESESLLSTERKRFNAEQIEDKLANLEANKEIDLLEQEQEIARLQLLVDNANAGTQAKVDAQIALDEFKEQSRQTNITRDKEIAEEEAELEKQKVATKQKTLSDIVAIAGAETAVGKAALIAKQLLMAKELVMEVSKTITFSAQAAARSTVAVAEGTAQTAKIGFPQNIPMLIGYAAQAAGIIGAITSAVGSAKSSAGSLGVGGGSVPTPQAPQVQTPSFNIVGGSETNQLASAIGGQTQEPVKAYVVSSDVTTSQEMDRNIVESASL